MGSYRSKFTLALLVVLFLGTADSVARAQISGIDHYRSRRGHGQSQPPVKPQRRSQPKVTQATYQLPIRTDPTPIFQGTHERLARRTRTGSMLRPTGKDGQYWNTADNSERSVELPFRKFPEAVAALPVSTTRKPVPIFSRAYRQQTEADFPEFPIDAQPQEPDDGNGVVLPPDAINRFKDPSILSDEDLLPGVIPRQTVPRPDQRDPIGRRKTNRPAPRSTGRDDRNDQEDRLEPDDSDPSLYDPADPRHPSAKNGPESWYRPDSQQRFLQRQPNFGAADPNAYASDVAPLPPSYSQPGYSQPGYSQPGYTQPSYAQPSYAQPEYAPVSVVDSYTTAVTDGYAPGPSYGSVYEDVCQSGCNGTPGYANGGCNSCGTGIVNGCIDSMFYLSLFGGYTNLSPITVADTDGALSNTVGDFRFDLDDGYGVGAALGQYQGRNLRTELEFSFRENDLASLTMPGNPAFVAPVLENAGIRSYSGMANVMWEFIKFPSHRVKPYVGAGFGFVNVEAEAALGGVNALAGVDDSDSSFGYQAIGGLNFRTNRMLDVFVEYRYLKADSLQLGNFGFDYETSNIFGGARIKF